MSRDKILLDTAQKREYAARQIQILHYLPYLSVGKVASNPRLVSVCAQVALRRQQAQEEAEARQLGVEILKPGDRAELVMGPGDTAGEEQGGQGDTVKIKTDTAEENTDQGEVECFRRGLEHF